MAKEYTKIYNELLEFLYSSNLTFSETRVLIFIIRYTISFHRAKASMSYSYIAKGTNMSESSIIRAVRSLEKRGIISVSRSSTRRNEIKLLSFLKSTSSTDDRSTSSMGDRRTSSTDDREEIKEEIKEYKLKKEETDFSLSSVEETEELSDEEWEKMMMEDDV